jgi:hypothetical protein
LFHSNSHRFVTFIGKVKIRLRLRSFAADGCAKRAADVLMLTGLDGVTKPALKVR